MTPTRRTSTWTPADLSSDPFYLDELAHDPLAFTSAAGARSLNAVLPAAWDELADDFGQVTLPVLFVHGSDDPVVPVAHDREWAGWLKRARLQIGAERVEEPVRGRDHPG